MRGNGDHEDAARLEDPRRPAQRPFVVVEMLEHVEHPEHLLPAARGAAGRRRHVREGHVEPARAKPALEEGVAGACDGHAVGGEVGQQAAGAAPDVVERPLREVGDAAAEAVEDDRAPADEPELLVLDPGQQLEVSGVESLAAVAPLANRTMPSSCGYSVPQTEQASAPGRARRPPPHAGQRWTRVWAAATRPRWRRPPSPSAWTGPRIRRAARVRRRARCAPAARIPFPTPPAAPRASSPARTWTRRRPA